jgi:hypothetical protein
MKPSPRLRAPVTIDGLNEALGALEGGVCGGGVMRPAALRGIWRDRLRPFWRLRPGLYEGMARRFATHGENFLVIEVAAESRRFFGERAAMLFLEALAAARSGSPGRCREILAGSPELMEGVADAPALLARTFKDAWKATGDAAFLERGFACYLKAYRDSGGDAFPGVNAAAMALLSGRHAEARELAIEVRNHLAGTGGGDYWAAVTRAECSLVLGEIGRAEEEYRAACAGTGVPRANLVTTRAQARLLLPCHGCDARLFDVAFPLPNIVCFTGHRIDEPGRPVPRFPAEQEVRVAGAIAEFLRANRVAIGFSSAAQGGDLLFAEAVRARPGGETHLFVPRDREGFRKTSVSLEGDPSWEGRFDVALEEADEINELESASGNPPGPADFDYINRVCLGAAMMRAREMDCELTLLAVWDGSSGGEGGTSGAVAMARAAGVAIGVIRPDGTPFHPREMPAALVPTEEIFAIVAFRGNGRTTPPRSGDARWLLWDDPFLSVVFPTATGAVQYAEAVAATGKTGVAMHYGPVARLENPLTGEEIPGGVHLKRTRQLLGACPEGRICATAEFASVARLEGCPAHFEYLGRLAPAPGTREQQLFQLARHPTP